MKYVLPLLSAYLAMFVFFVLGYAAGERANPPPVVQKSSEPLTARIAFRGYVLKTGHSLIGCTGIMVKNKLLYPDIVYEMDLPRDLYDLALGADMCLDKAVIGEGVLSVFKERYTDPRDGLEKETERRVVKVDKLRVVRVERLDVD